MQIKSIPTRPLHSALPKMMKSARSSVLVKPNSTRSMQSA